MERLPLESRAVVSAGYHAETHTLELEFSSGRVYRFTDVPSTVYDWLLRVPNKGVYVARHITGRYAFEDLSRPSTGGEDADLEALLEASLSAGLDRA